VAWDGSGLPPAAQARIDRSATTGLRTSLLSVPDATSLTALGFDAVGEVMGCTVEQISWQGWGYCGWSPSSNWMSGQWGPPGVAGPLARFGGYVPYVQAVNAGYDTALERMRAEATALKADGVVGVRLTDQSLGESNREFMALGTAVRARSRTRPLNLFTTELPGTDVAKLLLAGWAPMALQVAFEVAIRHDDYRTQYQASNWLGGSANVEVSGYTELVQYTRAAARDILARKIARVGADGGIVSDMRLSVRGIEQGEGHRDHVAEARIVGTAVARFRRHTDTKAVPLAILPLAPQSRK
jgi:uncharacterized protein YbjQ (UPF0145 family)